MFLENASQKGWIEVICGSMFSGKTEELIRRLKRAEFARLRVEIFKPRIDVRYSEEEVVSHDASAIRSTPVDSAQNILLMTSDVDVVGIDEAQFFDQGLVEVCRQLADSGVRVIVAGLDMDFTGKPFGPMPALMATAEYVTKVHAICVRCGNLAHHSHRLTNDEKQVMLGAQDSYEPICRHCFAELRKKSGNKRHLPVKNPDLFRTVRFRSIQLDTSIPSARGDCSSDKRNRKINIRNFQATEKTEKYFARGAEYTQHQPTVHNPIGRLYARIYRKIHDFRIRPPHTHSLRRSVAYTRIAVISSAKTYQKGTGSE